MYKDKIEDFKRNGSSIPTRVRNLYFTASVRLETPRFQHTYEGSKLMSVMRSDENATKFQHTYEGSKLVWVGLSLHLL